MNVLLSESYALDGFGFLLVLVGLFLTVFTILTFFEMASTLKKILTAIREMAIDMKEIRKSMESPEK